MKLSGDISSVIKLLHEHALNRSHNVVSKDDNIFIGCAKKGMLAHILEFFLDLCEEGKLSSFAFFLVTIVSYTLTNASSTRY